MLTDTDLAKLNLTRFMSVGSLLNHPNKEGVCFDLKADSLSKDQKYYWLIQSGRVARGNRFVSNEGLGVSDLSGSREIRLVTVLDYPNRLLGNEEYLASVYANNQQAADVANPLPPTREMREAWSACLRRRIAASAEASRRKVLSPIDDIDL